MDSNNEIVHDFAPFLRIYKDGRIERLLGTATVPPSDPDPQTGVSSKDIVIFPSTGVSARLYLPKPPTTPQRLPILVYFHGGGFCIETAFSATYHPFLNSLAADASLLIISVDYRRAPEHPIPAAYDDSWAAIQWVISHASGGSAATDVIDPWLTEHGDFSRLMVAGDSAGANIAHHMAMRAKGSDLSIESAVLIHPFFWGVEPIGKEPKEPAHRGMVGAMWKLVCPSSSGCDDPLLDPTAEGAPSLKEVACGRVLVCVAEMDMLRDRGWKYHDALASSGWEGVVEMMESEGENHVFYLFNRMCENAQELMKRVATFLNGEGGGRPLL
ncbi:hypothetical protein MRB53_033650 [Persea americana]|uniref:Uncharacterized protein n=1 Tax=Persea americana TaxID=3435 RepID=A0ACC2KVM6_PERAE|nr:hypothetical protein MRB53_033650 [Persea americana]